MLCDCESCVFLYSINEICSHYISWRAKQKEQAILKSSDTEKQGFVNNVPAVKEKLKVRRAVTKHSSANSSHLWAPARWVGGQNRVGLPIRLKLQGPLEDLPRSLPLKIKGLHSPLNLISTHTHTLSKHRQSFKAQKGSSYLALTCLNLPQVIRAPSSTEVHSAAAWWEGETGNLVLPIYRGWEQTITGKHSHIWLLLPPA